MFDVIDEQWLVHLDLQTELVNINNGSGYRGNCEQVDVDAVTEYRLQEVNDDSKADLSRKIMRLGISEQDGDNVVVTISTTLKSGLELKPRKIKLTRNPEVTLLTILTSLIYQNNSLQLQLQKAASELQLARTTLDTVVADKDEYQKLVLKRVAAILKERNFWIEKLQKSKSELEM